MIQQAIYQAVNGKDLGYDMAKEAMNEIMCGEAAPAQIASFITALRKKGESIEEITACAVVMRERAVHINPGRSVIDIVGTGGDEAGRFNISTTAMFVVAAGGVPVVKHGNRSVSSKCGAADVLECLGVNVGIPADQSEKLLEQTDLCFMFAQTYHSSEITLTGRTKVCEIRFRKIVKYEIIPEEFGFNSCCLKDLTGGSPEENAVITRNILSGKERGPKRDVVILNAGLALYLGNDNCSIQDCVDEAIRLIYSGAAFRKLGEFVERSGR